MLFWSNTSFASTSNASKLQALRLYNFSWSSQTASIFSLLITLIPYRFFQKPHGKHQWIQSSLPCQTWRIQWPLSHYYITSTNMTNPNNAPEIPPKVTIGNRLSHPRPSNFCLWLSGSFEWTSEAQRSEAQQLLFPKFPLPVGTVISKNPTIDSLPKTYWWHYKLPQFL